MKDEQVLYAIKLMKEKGMETRDILDFLFERFKEGEIPGRQLELGTEYLGHHLDPKFKEELIKRDCYDHTTKE